VALDRASGVVVRRGFEKLAAKTLVVSFRMIVGDVLRLFLAELEAGERDNAVWVGGLVL